MRNMGILVTQDDYYTRTAKVARCSNCGYAAEAHDDPTGRCLFAPKSVWYHSIYEWHDHVWGNTWKRLNDEGSQAV